MYSEKTCMISSTTKCQEYHQHGIPGTRLAGQMAGSMPTEFVAFCIESQLDFPGDIRDMVYI